MKLKRLRTDAANDGFRAVSLERVLPCLGGSQTRGFGDPNRG